MCHDIDGRALVRLDLDGVSAKPHVAKHVDTSAQSAQQIIALSIVHCPPIRQRHHQIDVTRVDSSVLPCAALLMYESLVCEDSSDAMKDSVRVDSRSAHLLLRPPAPLDALFE